VSALLLPAVGGFWWKTGIALAANCFITVVSFGKKSKRGVVHSSSQTKDQVQSRLLLDVVVGKSTSILQLFSGENKTLLIRRDSFLILNFSFDVFDSVGGFYIKSDGFPSEGFDKDLHIGVLICLTGLCSGRRGCNKIRLLR